MTLLPIFSGAERRAGKADYCEARPREASGPPGGGAAPGVPGMPCEGRAARAGSSCAFSRGRGPAASARIKRTAEWSRGPKPRLGAWACSEGPALEGAVQSRPSSGDPGPALEPRWASARLGSQAAVCINVA